MRLVPSDEVLTFLGQSAPRPWIKRMLQWMIYSGELIPYFTHGRIRPYTRVFALLINKELWGLRESSDFDTAVRAAVPPEIADQIIGSNSMDAVYDAPIEWSDDEPAHAVSSGYFLLADEIDWERGELKLDLHKWDNKEENSIWQDDEHLASDFEEPDYDIRLSGLCFSLDDIEMLHPTGNFGRMTPLRSAARPTGRPPKWDWEGAMTHLLALAQHPDGLPIGPGAQAQIEQLIADWFIETAGDCPATSQIRTRAQSVMRSIGKA